MSNTANRRDAAPKGRPSGNARGGSGLHDVSAGTKAGKEGAKYTSGDDRPAGNARIRHENRNVNKGENDGE